MTQQRKRLNLAVTESQYQQLKEKAEREGETINCICRRIFKNYLEKKQLDFY